MPHRARVQLVRLGLREIRQTVRARRRSDSVEQTLALGSKGRGCKELPGFCELDLQPVSVNGKIHERRLLHL